MKNKKYLVGIPLILIIIIGCYYIWNNKLKIEDSNIIEYKKSLKVWNELKEQNSNSYTYETSFNSWTGYGTKTKIEVKNGVPVFRNYEESMFNGPGDIKILDSFTEDKNNLNSNTKGASAIIIDKIYEQCINEYLNVDSKNNKISFKTDSNGIMTYCGYYPINCIDDCDKSVKIEKLEWLK